jgi:hypothetical protein
VISPGVGPSAGLVGDFHSNGLYRLGDVTGGGATPGNALNGPGGALSGLPPEFDTNCANPLFLLMWSKKWACGIHCGIPVS